MTEEVKSKVYVVTGVDQFIDVTQQMAAEAKIKADKGRPMLVKAYVGDFHGCGHWRVVYPTVIISSLREDVKCVFDFAFNPEDRSAYQHFDLLILQRQVAPGFAPAFDHFLNIRNSNKLPVAAVFEIDDWLFGIPEYNMAHDLYTNKLGEKHLSDILKKFDGMIVSTYYLKKLYSKYVDTKTIYVVKNYIPRMLWDFDNDEEHLPPVHAKPRILFAGGANRFAVAPGELHKKDDLSVIEPLIRRTCDEWQWVFMGARPLRIADLFEKGKIEHLPWESNLNYPRALRKVKADLAISPLLDNAFNRGKSNIKILEYGAVRIPGIYTDLEPYNELPDFMKVKISTPEAWEAKIREFLADQNLREQAQKAQRKVLDESWMEDNVEKITNTYKEIVENTRKKRKLIL